MNSFSIHNCLNVDVNVVTQSDPSCGWVELTARRRGLNGQNKEEVSITFFSHDLDTLLSSFRGVFYKKHTDTLEPSNSVE